MKTVASTIEDNDDGKLDRRSCALSPPKKIANPVVYKLVRVEGDGRLVPATDDEVMEVEEFLEHDNNEMRVVADTGQSLECISIERSSSGKLRLECSKGTGDADLGKLNAKLEVKHEEKLRLSGGLPIQSCVNIDSQCSADKFPVIDAKQTDIPYQEVPSIASSLNYSISNQSGSIDQCSRPSEGVIESGSSMSAVCSALEPDASIFEGEICLDKLSIRELHELFKVMFSRETTVKDKQWLKRRIAMSLTNSCNVSATSFIIRDNKVVRKCEENSGNGNATAVISMDNVAGEEGVKDLSAMETCGFEDNQVAEKRPRNNDAEYEGGEDHQMLQRAAKRIRKPTKRYIEELSENESREHGSRLLSSNISMGLGDSTTSNIRPTTNVPLKFRTFITKLVYLGGSGVQVPCVSRVRRSRPRKDITSLMKFHPNGMVETAKLGDKDPGEHSSYGYLENRDKVLKSRSTLGKFHQLSAFEPGKEKPSPEMSTNEIQELRSRKADPPSNTRDENIVTIPTAKGGMRRKHHRAWTLIEVMKLVEGVSLCGTGRWSEIKRLSFGPFSYRTSVDLKDKWRNLLKASSASAPADEGANGRKQGTVPIPEHILVRVRELAEKNSQVPPNFSSSKLVAAAGKAREDNRLGYL